MTPIEISTDRDRLDVDMRWALGTQDAHGLYAQFGFTSWAKPERQMELLRPQAVPAPSGNAEH
jgi:hypothetical protein